MCSQDGKTLEIDSEGFYNMQLHQIVWQDTRCCVVTAYTSRMPSQTGWHVHVIGGACAGRSSDTLLKYLAPAFFFTNIE